MQKGIYKLIITLTVIISILIVVSSFFGLYNYKLYTNETVNWKTQCIGQDWINLVMIVPVFVFSLLLSHKTPSALFIWAGTLIYIIYTYIIYCFNIHFNFLFIFYCVILSLSFYALILFLTKQAKIIFFNYPLKTLKISAIYFIITAIIFLALWLSDIIFAIKNNQIPQNIIDTGLFTNPVHVLDLSIVLPGIFIAGILILKNKKSTYFLCPLILTFIFLMDITIAALTAIMKMKGLGNTISVSVIMLLLAFFSFTLLFFTFKKEIYK